MATSATSPRERRKALTARALTDTARRMTVDHGLSGYTVEEVCEEVGVSRRTFFNYFASKENAVLGLSLDMDESGAAERFLAAGPRGIRRLVDDVMALMLERWEYGGLTVDDLPLLTRAFEREPRLIAHLLQLAGVAERDDRELIERREGLPEGDLRAAAAVQLVGAVFRASVEEFFAGPDGDELPVIVRRRLDVVRELLH
ncbi:TetR family transcriptional regulator [Leifsonia sp. F6_8S_P_1B]|uniref:TetR family transcriptional regulator n=1 Tax=Leifsonia williamsii TaxID=3035919 RepID=A0ABT8KAZ8_9MICO|nr:TetR family transcriptional regulator [Leifsonia williamsii]MDN4614605.1 TetR family transcriptional regulator [Leifsonia williamsii]